MIPAIRNRDTQQAVQRIYLVLPDSPEDGDEDWVWAFSSLDKAMEFASLNDGTSVLSTALADDAIADKWIAEARHDTED